jgi:hypothetical protein
VGQKREREREREREKREMAPFLGQSKPTKKGVGVKTKEEKKKTS